MNTRTYSAELFHQLKEAESKRHVAIEGWVWRHNVAHKNQPETPGLAWPRNPWPGPETPGPETPGLAHKNQPETPGLGNGTKPKIRLTDTQLTEMRSSTGIFFATTSLSYYKRFEKI